MIEKIIIVTNNVLSDTSFRGNHRVDFIEGSLLDVLIKVRDYIHLGHRLMTHPLMGSIKPNQTPYKTVAITLKAYESVDLNSLILIENSIEITLKLLNNKPPRNWPEEVLEDYRAVDFELIKNALN
ncbi:GrdX family protein [Fonticella tunisiensis]|uniref:GrdX protein n=1 Tax=Fonticella tunisiensis TaxID=1096341 RepID=A0A4R7K9I1_9CLOT|nr:GrdX family protein [Fonticella tunisiensis]TDT50729.1 hypothetical protein EDD71_12518 [Fonticella tunisiensis]